MASKSMSSLYAIFGVERLPLCPELLCHHVAYVLKIRQALLQGVHGRDAFHKSYQHTVHAPLSLCSHGGGMSVAHRRSES